METDAGPGVRGNAPERLIGSPSDASGYLEAADYFAADAEKLRSCLKTRETIRIEPRNHTKNH